MILDIAGERTWYYFAEDGSCDKNAKIPDGFYTDRNGYGYSSNGKGYMGLQLIDGVYYYFNYNGYAITGTYAGFLFGDDYKAYTGLLEKDGTVYYYENGKTGAYGLTKHDDAYYFVSWGGVITGGDQYIGATNCDMPVGNYKFGDDGRMFNGFVTIGGEIYYYVNGVTAVAGLVKVGDY